MSYATYWIGVYAGTSAVYVESLRHTRSNAWSAMLDLLGLLWSNRTRKATIDDARRRGYRVVRVRVELVDGKS